MKKEILTRPRACDNQHDTRSRKKPPERYSIVSPPPLLPYQSYAAKLRASVDNPYADTPQAKRSKVGERYVGCCTCGQKSQCSTSRCDCRKADIVCTTCRSSCCGNFKRIIPTPLATTTESKGTNGHTSSDPIEATPVMNKDATYQHQPCSRVTNNAVTNQGQSSSDSDTDAASNQEADSTVSPAPSSIGDIDGCMPTEMDVKLAELFDGECVRNNGSTYLNGNIHDDSLW